MVLPRVLTAVVAAPLFLWALYLGSLPFLAFMFVVILLALWEFHQMAETGGYATQSWWGIAGGLVLVMALLFPGLKISLPFQNQAPAFVIVWVVFAWILREIFRRDKSLSMLRLAMSALGLLFVVWPLGYLILLRELRGPSAALYDVGRQAAFFLVFIVWAQDIAAWAVGLTLGKRRMAAQISPKKSWEGAAGGFVAAMVLALVLRETWLFALFTRAQALVIAAGVAVLAQCSDLAESLLKRCFGVKDSSDLLPGHGGVLDRFDAFLFSTPFLYYALVLLGRTV